jgi:hypothetical protein
MYPPKIKHLYKKPLRRDFLNAKKLSFFTKKLYQRGLCNLNLTLHYGNSALINSQPIVTSHGFLLKFILLLKRVVRKKGKSFRFFFFRAVNLIRVSKQSKGARMGKGKGKSITPLQRFKPYQSLVEFAGIRYRRLVFISNFLSNRLATDLFLYVGPFLTLFSLDARYATIRGHLGFLLSTPLHV